MKIPTSISRLLPGIISITCLSISGCLGSINHVADFSDHYDKTHFPQVTVGRINDDTGIIQKVDIRHLFAETITKELVRRNLLEKDSDGRSAVLECSILKYLPGNAFKRWLLPGWGATELQVICYLKNPSDSSKLGSISVTARAMGSSAITDNIAAIGTIGAWKYIFQNAAERVAIQIYERLYPEEETIPAPTISTVPANP